jgi:hypothetical protein
MVVNLLEGDRSDLLLVQGKELDRRPYRPQLFVDTVSKHFQILSLITYQQLASSPSPEYPLRGHGFIQVNKILSVEKTSSPVHQVLPRSRPVVGHVVSRLLEVRASEPIL